MAVKVAANVAGGFLFFTMTGAIKSWLSCQLKRSEVKLILSERGWWRAAGKGLRGSDLLIVRGMMDCDGRLQSLAPVNYEENQRRQEVALGGRAIFSPPDAPFKTWRHKNEDRKKERDGGTVQQGAVFLKMFQIRAICQMQVGRLWKLVGDWMIFCRYVCFYLCKT